MKNFKRFAKALLTAFMRASALTFVVSVFVFIKFYYDGEVDGTDLLPAFTFQASLQAIATLMFALVDEKSNYLGAYPQLVRLREKIFRRRNKNSKLFWKGMVFYVEGYLQDALELFHEIDTDKLKKSDRSELEYYKGRAYNSLGFTVNAVKCYETALEFGYKDMHIYLRIGSAKEAYGDFDGAVETYEKLAQVLYYSDSAYINIGMAYIRKGDGVKALEAFKKAIDKKYGYANALGGMALAYLLLGDMDKSFEYYEKAIANNISDVNGYKEYYNNMKQIAETKLKKSEQTV